MPFHSVRCASSYAWPSLIQLTAISMWQTHFHLYQFSFCALCSCSLLACFFSILVLSCRLHGIALHFGRYDDWLCTRAWGDAFWFFLCVCVSENRHRQIHSMDQTITNERCITLLQQRKETKTKTQIFHIFRPVQATHITYGNRYDLHEFHFNFIIYILFRWSVHKVLFHHWILHFILLPLRSTRTMIFMFAFFEHVAFLPNGKKHRKQNASSANRDMFAGASISSPKNNFKTIYQKKKWKEIKRTPKTNDKNRKNLLFVFCRVTFKWPLLIYFDSSTKANEVAAQSTTVNLNNDQRSTWNSICMSSIQLMVPTETLSAMCFGWFSLIFVVKKKLLAIDKINGKMSVESRERNHYQIYKGDHLQSRFDWTVPPFINQKFCWMIFQCVLWFTRKNE